MFEPALGGRELEEQVHVGLARHSDVEDYGGLYFWFVFPLIFRVLFYAFLGFNNRNGLMWG